MGQSPWGAWHLQVPSAGMGALLLFAAVRNKTLGFDVWLRCIGWVYKQHILSFGTCWGAKRKRKHWWNYSVRWVECLGGCLRTAIRILPHPILNGVIFRKHYWHNRELFLVFSMLENTRSVWARCWLQRHLNSQRAACHSPKAGKSPGSFHSSHGCPISHTRCGYIIIISQLLGCFFASDGCLHPLLDSAYMATPFLGKVVAELNSVPFYLPWTSTPTKYIWPAYPAPIPAPGSCRDPGLPCQLGRGSAWALWSKLPIPGLNPPCQQAFPLRAFCGLPREMTKFIKLLR